MNIDWGKKLTITMIIFAGIMATMVTIAMRQNIDLVDKNYYKKELAFQEQIDGMQNSKNNEALEIYMINNDPNIYFQFKDKVNDGEIHLFRPSNAEFDLKLPIKTDKDRKQIVSMENLEKGLWRVKVTWTSKGDSYYFEKPLEIP